jgi:hypothetical protein
MDRSSSTAFYKGGQYVDKEPLFRRIGPPADAEVARVADRVHRRVMRLMRLRGIGPRADREEKPIRFGAMSRCLRNYTAHRYAGGWQRARAPAGALQGSGMSRIPKMPK